MRNQIVSIDGMVINPINQTEAFTESSTYGFVNTRSVLDTFSHHGWSPVSETAIKVRKAEKQGFQKHLIRLEHPDFTRIEGLSDNNNSRPQLVVLNSHDGSSRLSLIWGMIRMACLNGIIAGTGISGFNITHSKNITQRLPEAIDFMLGNFPKFVDQVQYLQNKTLTESATQEFTRRLFDARLVNVNSEILNVNYKLPIARYQDNSSDAFTIFNRGQEVMMRGGIHYTYRHGAADQYGNISSKIVNATTRKVTSINSQVKLNQLAYDTIVELAA